ncbi:MAG: hypothetical protein IKI67_05560 [Bacteroidales bacterium]|nr:hypothetical protein [Bacteroidales bacterium]
MLQTFETKDVLIKRPVEMVYLSFSDMEQLMERLPQEYREKVRVNGDSIEGEYNGMSLGLSIVEKHPNSKLVLKPTGDFPLDFSLIFDFESAPEYSTNLKISLQTQMSWVERALVGGKIQQMLDKISESLSAKL